MRDHYTAFGVVSFMFISQENNLLEHQKAIEAFWQQQVVQSTLCCDDYKLQYAYVIPEKATRAVVISSGRIERLLKYKDIEINK